MNRDWTIILVAILATGCVGTEVGNPQDESSVTVEFSADILEDPRALTLDNGIEIDEAWLAIEEVGLRETSRCEESERFDDEARFAVELLTGRELPAAPMLTQQATDFCRMELELNSLEDVDRPADAPDILADGSAWVTGSLEDGTPFEILVDVDETIRLDGPFEARGETRFLVAFDIRTWVSPANFDGIEADPDGVLRLTAEADGEAANSVTEAIESSGRLVRDVNGDGAFDSGDEIVASSSSEEQ